MSEQKCRKVYVPVNLDVDAEGNIRPRLIRWIDGRVYEIDRLKHKCRAASTKVGGCGIRYTVMIGGHESFLFNEDEKWFVEAKEQCLTMDIYAKAKYNRPDELAGILEDTFTLWDAE